MRNGQALTARENRPRARAFRYIARFIVNANHSILLIIENDLRDNFAYVKLRTHLLNLRCLLFHRWHPAMTLIALCSRAA